MTAKKIDIKCYGRHEEAAAAEALKPGHLLVLGSAGTLTKHASNGGFAELLIAKEDALQGKTVDDAYASGDIVAHLIPLRGDVFLGRLAAAAPAVVVGNLLKSAGDGTFTKLPSVAGGLLVNTVAASTALSNADTDEHDYSSTGTVPAGSLKAGSVLRLTGHIVVSAAAGSDTTTVKVYLGSILLATSPAVNATTGDIIEWDILVKVRTAGASGTLTASGWIANGVAGTATALPISVGSTAVDTTVALTYKASMTYSATTATLTSALQGLTAELTGATPEVPLVAAAEAKDNSAGASEVFVKLRAL